MLRITSGLYRGRVLRTGGNPVIRPTMSRVKLAFFDTVQNEIREKIFLDGFAGTGNIGIEALSRGAEYTIFIDELPEAARLIGHNIEKIGIRSDFYRIVRGDFNRSIITLAKEGFQFDFVYLDPPYGILEYADPLKVIFKRKALKIDGTIVLERPTDLPFQSVFFRLARTQPVGGKCLDYYRYGS